MIPARTINAWFYPGPASSDEDKQYILPSSEKNLLYSCWKFNSSTGIRDGFLSPGELFRKRLEQVDIGLIVVEFSLHFWVRLFEVLRMIIVEAS